MTETKIEPEVHRSIAARQSTTTMMMSTNNPQQDKSMLRRDDQAPFMYTIPNPYYRHSNWMKSGAEFAGIMIAGRCILAMAFFGFGVLLMGIVMIVVSNCFKNPHVRESSAKGREKNPVQLLGPVFLGIGGLVFVISVFLLILAIKSAKKSLVGIADGSEIATINTLDTIGAPDGHSYESSYFPPPEEPYGRDYATSPFPYSAKQPYSATFLDGQTIGIICGPLAPAYPPNNTGVSYSLSSIFK